MGALFRTPTLYGGPLRVPTYPVELIEDHPLSAGLLVCVVPGCGGAFTNLASEAFNLTASGSNTIGGSPYGPGRSWTGGQATSNGISGTPAATSHYSVGYRCFRTGSAPSSNTNLFGGIYDNPQTSPYGSSVIYSASSTKTYYLNTNQNAAAQYLNSGVSVASAGATQDILFTCSAGVSVVAYSSGVEVASAGAPSAVSYGSTACFVAGQSSQTVGAVDLRYVFYDYALSPDLVAWLAAEPFAMLRPVMRRRFYVSGSSSPTNLSASQVAWTWVPNADDLNVRTQITAASETWEWNSVAAVVNAGVLLTTAQKGWNWLSWTPDLNLETQLTAPQSEWEWTPNSADLNEKTELTATKASWEWIGITPTIAFAVLLTAAFAAWSWVGHALGGFGSKILGGATMGGVMRGVIRRVMRGVDDIS